MKAMSRAAALLVALLSAPASAYVLGDDFQVHTTGQLPVPWQDVRDLIPIPKPVAPSATAENVTGSSGSATKALRISPQLARASGIYQAVPVSGRYKVTAEVRVDQFSDPTSIDVIDFPVQIAFAKDSADLYAAPQVGPYVSSHTKRWHIYLKRIDLPATITDIPLGIDVVPNRWYRVEFEFTRSSGAYHTTITDLSTGLPADCGACDGTFSNWTAASGAFDLVALFDAEVFAEIETSNLASLDNVNVETFPAATPSVGCGIGPELALLVPMLAAARSRRR